MFQEYEDKRRKDGFFTKVRSDQNRNDEIVILDEEKQAMKRLLSLKKIKKIQIFNSILEKFKIKTGMMRLLSLIKINKQIVSLLSFK